MNKATVYRIRAQLLGIFVAVIGGVFALFSPHFPRLEALGPEIGIVVTLLGIGFTLAVGVVRFETVASAVTELPEHLEKLELANRSHSLLGRIQIWRHDPQQPFHTRVASEVLLTIVEKHALKDVARFVNETENNSQSLSFDDYSPVYEMLSKMCQHLPKDGVWFGVTLLQNPAAWKEPAIQSFENFRNDLRDRAREGKALVYRLYYFTDDNAFNQLKDELHREVQAGIHVRYLIGGREPTDMSILWSRGNSAKPTKANKSTLDHPRELIKLLEGLCALEFVSRDSAILTGMKVHSVASDQFRNLTNQFCEFWSQGKDFTPS